MPHNSPAALIGPVLERIHQNASGRKYSKLRQDAKVGAADQHACVPPPPSAHSSCSMGGTALCLVVCVCWTVGPG